jgi:hypothetical protein
MKAKTLISLFGLLWVAIAGSPLIAQTSAYQSSDSTTSIFLDDTTVSLVANVSDTKFTGSYLHITGGPRTPIYGVSIFGKPSTSFSSQFFKTTSQEEIGGGITLGIHSPFAQTSDKPLGKHQGVGFLTDDLLLMQTSYSRSAAKLVTTPDLEPENRTFDKVGTLIAYNAYKYFDPLTLIGGVAAGVSKGNNINSLTPVTIDSPLVQSATGLSPTFVAYQSASGYMGTYKTFISKPLYTDAVLLPHADKIKWITLDLFTRSELAGANRYIEGGVGLFVADPKHPSHVLGGISMSWRNGAPAIGVVGGWAF